MHAPWMVPQFQKNVDVRMAEKILEWASDPNVVLAAASLGTSFVQTRHGIKQDKELHEKETFQNSILSSVALKEHWTCIELQ